MAEAVSAAKKATSKSSKFALPHRTNSAAERAKKAAAALAAGGGSGPMMNEADFQESAALQRAGQAPGGEDGELLYASNKEGRLKKQRKRMGGGYIVEDMKSKLGAHSQELKLMMEGTVEPQLLSQLFHREFKTQLSALSTLQAQLARQTISPKVLASSFDLLLRYIVLKIWESNTQAHAKGIELLHAMLAGASAAEYSMSDAEAQIVLPSWVRAHRKCR